MAKPSENPQVTKPFENKFLVKTTGGKLGVVIVLKSLHSFFFEKNRLVLEGYIEDFKANEVFLNNFIKKNQFF